MPRRMRPRQAQLTQDQQAGRLACTIRTDQTNAVATQNAGGEIARSGGHQRTFPPAPVRPPSARFLTPVQSQFDIAKADPRRACVPDAEPRDAVPVPHCACVALPHLCGSRLLPGASSLSNRALAFSRPPAVRPCASGTPRIFREAGQRIAIKLHDASPRCLENPVAGDHHPHPGKSRISSSSHRMPSISRWFVGSSSNSISGSPTNARASATALYPATGKAAHLRFTWIERNWAENLLNPLFKTPGLGILNTVLRLFQARRPRVLLRLRRLPASQRGESTEAASPHRQDRRATVSETLRAKGNQPPAAHEATPSPWAGATNAVIQQGLARQRFPTNWIFRCRFDRSGAHAPGSS